MTEAPIPATTAAPTDDGWQPLPARARGVLMLSHAIGTGVFGAIASAALTPASVALFDRGWWLPLPLFALASAFGAWLGRKRWSTTRWRLDATGFSLRKGRMWQSDVRVPRTRVQHLDLKRGPLERTRGLASLVLHTAGTRERAVTVPALDEGDAERLRDALARQVERDDDDA